MDITGSTALVTGASRGIGRHLALELLDQGAAKVYAAARNPGSVDVPGAEVIQLDITDPVSVAAAAEAAPDVTLLVNNAGSNTYTNLVTGDLDAIRLDLDTHFYGTLSMVRAFAPILARNGGGAILNVLSAMSWFAWDGANAYGVAKSAEWSLTNGVRLELAAQGTLVTGVHLGMADTDMSARSGYEGDMLTPTEVARGALEGLKADRLEVLLDDWSRHVKASLADDPSAFYRLADRVS